MCAMRTILPLSSPDRLLWRLDVLKDLRERLAVYSAGTKGGQAAAVLGEQRNAPSILPGGGCARTLSRPSSKAGALILSRHQADGGVGRLLVTDCPSSASPSAAAAPLPHGGPACRERDEPEAWRYRPFYRDHDVQGPWRPSPSCAPSPKPSRPRSARRNIFAPTRLTASRRSKRRSAPGLRALPKAGLEGRRIYRAPPTRARADAVGLEDLPPVAEHAGRHEGFIARRVQVATAASIAPVPEEVASAPTPWCGTPSASRPKRV